MIALRRLNNQAIMVNPDLIETLEATPDTVVTLTSGNKLIVRDSMEEIREKIIESTAFTLQDGSVGYWAPNGNGEYYYFGPDGTLYLDSYAGEVQSSDLSNAVGNVATYQFPPI